MSEVFGSYQDFYRRGPYAPYVRGHRSAGRAPVHLLEIAQPAGHYPDPPTPELKLILTRACRSAARFDLGPGGFRALPRPGDIFLVPPDTPADFVAEGSHEILALALPFAALKPILEEQEPGFRDFGRLHAAPVRDTFLKAVCRRLWEEAADGNPHGSLFADGPVLSLTSTLLRLKDGQASAPVRRAPTLSSVRLRRVVEFVEARFDTDLMLADLAAAAGMSVSGFARAFKATTGLTPHRYVTERRIERAKTLLRDGDATVTEVALTCGFVSPQHFATVFRRRVGLSPRSFRQGG